MYSMKATRMHVKNGASLSAPSPILRSTSPVTRPPTPTSMISTGNDSVMKNLTVGTLTSVDPASKERTVEHSCSREQSVQITTEAIPTLNSSSSEENSVRSHLNQINHQQSPNSSNYFDKHFDFTYSSSDMDRSPTQKDPSTPPMRNSEVSETTPPSSPRIRASTPLSSYDSFSKTSPQTTKAVKITVTSGQRSTNTSPPKLKTSVIQSPTRVRLSPSLQYTKKQIPLFYSPLLMRQLKQIEAEKSQKKDKNYFTVLKGTNGIRKSSPFNCLNPVDDCILPESSSSTEDIWNTSSSSVLLNQYNQDLFLDLGDTLLDPPSSTDLMTHENRWIYQSNLAGHHKQDLHKLDLSHRIYCTPIALMYGVPPKAASMITELKYNASNLDSQTLSFLLELIDRIFPMLSSLTLHLSHAIFKEDLSDPLLDVLGQKVDGSRHTSHPHRRIKTADDLEVVKNQRLYILSRLPHLSTINDVPVTEDERQFILPPPQSTDHITGNRPLDCNKDMKPLSILEDRNESILIDEGIERELSTSSASAFTLDRSCNETMIKTTNKMELAREVFEVDSVVHPSVSQLCPVGRSYSWSHPDLSDRLAIRPSHSVDEIDFRIDYYFAPSDLARQHSCESSMSNLSDLVMTMGLEHTVHGAKLLDRKSSNNQAHTSSCAVSATTLPRLTTQSQSHLRRQSSSSTTTSDDDLTSESSSLGHNVPSSSIDNYFSSSDSLADSPIPVQYSPMPVQYQIQRIENRLKVNGHESESDSNSGIYISCRGDFKSNPLDEAETKRKFTRIKKDGSLPPTSPASIPRAPMYRLKKQKRHITISNMESLRKVKPIADQLLDDEEEQSVEEQDSPSLSHPC